MFWAAGSREILGVAFSSFRMSGSVCGICLQSFHEKSDKKFQVASLDSCNHRFCLRCIELWSKIKTSCPTCRTEFKYVNSSNGQRHEFKANIPEPDTESEYSESDFDVENLSGNENSDQYTSDDGFVVNDGLIQYDTDYDSGSEEDEKLEGNISSINMRNTDTMVDLVREESSEYGRNRSRVGAKHFRSALNQLEEMRLKRRRTGASSGQAEPSNRTAQAARQHRAPRGSKFFPQAPAPVPATETARPQKRRIREARSDSDSEPPGGVAGASIPGAEPASHRVPRGGWLARLKSQVTAPQAT